MEKRKWRGRGLKVNPPCLKESRPVEGSQFFSPSGFGMALQRLIERGATKCPPTRGARVVLQDLVLRAALRSPRVSPQPGRVPLLRHKFFYWCIPPSSGDLGEDRVQQGKSCHKTQNHRTTENGNDLQDHQVEPLPESHPVHKPYNEVAQLLIF